MLQLKIHHIGYLVKKIESAKSGFEALGYLPEGPVFYDSIRKADICFLSKDSYRVELVCPKCEDSIVWNLLKKYKNAPYHICYETYSFEEDLSYLTLHGFTAMGVPTPAPAIDGRRVVFLMSPTLGMIELLDVTEADS